jgi:hypothetical protein
MEKATKNRYMKNKLLIGLLFIIFLLFTSASKLSDLNNWTIYQDGVTYRVFTFDHSSGTPIFVINVTKEKLEMEKLNLEIKKLKSSN